MSFKDAAKSSEHSLECEAVELDRMSPCKAGVPHCMSS